MNPRIHHIAKTADAVGNVLVDVFHRLALFGIGAATVWAASGTFMELFAHPRADVGDLLLLFIYLEIGAMVGIYFRTNHMPVRFLLYIAITALTRRMIEIMSYTTVDLAEMMAVTAATLLFAVSTLIVRYTSARYPSDKKDDIA